VVVALLLAFVIGVLADLRDRAVERLLPEPEVMPQPADAAGDAEEPEAALRPSPDGSVEEAPDADDDAEASQSQAAGSVNDDLSMFWCTHFVEPGYRLGVLLSVLGAGWLLFALWGWHADTPVVRWFLGVVETPLFNLGDSAFAIADVLLALVLVASVFYIGGWSQQVSYNLAYRRVRDAGLRQALATFTQYVIIVAGVLLALRIIGFDITTLTVFAASLGVGIGFGLQNIINNFVSGVLLLAERPLKVGDFVSIGSNLGSVTRIGIRSLTMRTLDKQEVIIPNGSVISGEFTNWTRSDDLLRNVHYIRIRYEDDAELAIRLIERILRRHPHVLADPAPGVFLWEYSESSVDLRVQYCFRMNEGPGGLVIRSEVLLAIGRSFRQHGLKMPHARRDVTMHLDEDSRGLLASLGASKPEL
jgi:potassium efflux system protein